MKFRDKLKPALIRPQIGIGIVLTIAIAYFYFCLFLFLRQRHLIFRPSNGISKIPSSPDFKMPYREVQIPVGNSGEYLHSWWVPAPVDKEQFDPIPNEPVKAIESNITILYLCGAGGNKSYYNNLARVQAMRQQKTRRFQETVGECLRGFTPSDIALLKRQNDCAIVHQIK